MEHIGPIAGLGAAACWAVASVWYTRVPIGAGAMTTFKNVLATGCLLVVLWFSSLVMGEPMFQASIGSWLYIGVSGICGLFLADVAYFRSIQILGARRGLTLTLLTPPATAILGQVWLGDALDLFVWSCILMTIVGIGIVMRERSEPTAEQQIRPGSTQWGVACALMGIAFMAVGSVILKRGTESVGAIEGTFIRLVVAAACGSVVSVALGQFREIAAVMKDRTGLVYLSAASFLGTVLGVYLMLVAFKYCQQTGIAATLTATTPLFVIPVVYFVYKQTISPLAIAGASVAFAGVCGLLSRG